MTEAKSLWRAEGFARHFLIPDALSIIAGELQLFSLANDHAQLDPTWAAQFEVTEAEAQGWVQEQFGAILSDLRQRIDARLASARASLDAAKQAPVSDDTPITPAAVPAMLALLKAMPQAVVDSVSGDGSRVMRANGVLAELAGRLRGEGVDVGIKLDEFPFRLAGLRREFEALRRSRDD